MFVLFEFFRQGEQEVEEAAHEPTPEEDTTTEERNNGVERDEDWRSIHLSRGTTVDAQFIVLGPRGGKHSNHSKKIKFKR